MAFETTLQVDVDSRPAQAGFQRYESATRRAERQTETLNREVRRAEGTFSTFGRTVRTLTGAFAALGGALVAREFVRLADTATLLESRLRVVTNSSRELQQVQERLFDISQETRTALEATSTLFFRVARGREEIGRSVDQILRFTETIQQLAVVSGASAQEANAAVIQLSQGLAAGQVRGEELRSVMEQLPAVARAAAEGMGLTLGEFRERSLEGEIQAQQFFDAILRGAADAEDQFRQLDRTVGQAFTQLRNELLRSVGLINEGTGATEDLADAIDSIREVVGSNVFQGGVELLIEFIRTVAEEGQRTATLIDETARTIGSLVESLTSFADVDIPELREVLDFYTTLFAGLRALPLAALRELRGEGAGGPEVRLSLPTPPDPTETQQANDAIQRTIDLTEDERKAFEKLRDELQPLVAAQKEFEASQKLIADAAEAGIIDLEELVRLNELLTEQYREQLDPLGVIREELEREQEVLQMSDEQREVHNRLLEVEARLRAAGVDLTEAQRKELEKELKAIQDLNEANESAEESTRSFQRAQERFAQEIRRVGEQVGDIFTNNIIDSFENGFRNIEALFERFLKSLAATALRNAIVVPMATAFVGAAPGLFGIGGAQAATGAGGNIGMAGNALSLGSTLSNIGAGLTTPVFSAGSLASFAPSLFSTGAVEAGTGALAATPFASTLANSFTPGSILGGFAGNFLASQLFGGNPLGASIGGGLGGAGGAILGSLALTPALGPLAPIVGAFLGAFGGNALGGLFGPSPPRVTGTQVFQARPSGLTMAETLAKDIDPEKARQAFAPLGGFFSGIEALTGTDALQGFQVSSNFERDRRTSIFFGGESGSETRIRVSGEPGDLVAAAKEVLSNPRLWEDLGPEVATAITNSTAESLKELASDIQFAEALDEMFTRAELRSGFLATLENLEQQFEDAKARAKELGLSTEELAANFENMTEQLESERGLQLRLEAEGLSGAGSAIVTLAHQISVLREEMDAGIITAETFAGVIDQRFQQAFGQLSRSQIEALIDELEKAGVEIPNLTKVIQELSEVSAAANDNFPQVEQAVRGAIQGLRSEISGLDSELSLLTREAERRINVFRQERDAARAFADQIDGLINQFTTSPQSGLSPQAIFDNAQAAFRAAIDAPQGSPLRGQVAERFSAFMEAASTIFARGPEFARIRDDALEQLKDLKASAELEASNADRQLQALEQALNLDQRQTELQQLSNDTLVSQIHEMQDQKSILQEQLDELRAIASGLGGADRDFGQNTALNRALAAAFPSFTSDFGGGAFSRFFTNLSPTRQDLAAAIIEQFGGLPGRAHGGPVTMGSAYIVGEQGREVFVPRTNGSIIANDNVMNTANLERIVQNQVEATLQSGDMNARIGRMIVERLDEVIDKLDRTQRGGKQQFARTGTAG